MSGRDAQARIRNKRLADAAKKGRSMLGELTGEEIDVLLRSEAVGRIGCYGFGRRTLSRSLTPMTELPSIATRARDSSCG